MLMDEWNVNVHVFDQDKINPEVKHMTDEGCKKKKLTLDKSVQFYLWIIVGFLYFCMTQLFVFSNPFAVLYWAIYSTGRWAFEVFQCVVHLLHHIGDLWWCWEFDDDTESHTEALGPEWATLLCWPECPGSCSHSFIPCQD